MKRPARAVSPQLNLPLASNQAVEIPKGKQTELKLALVELLIGGFQANVLVPKLGGENEPEVNR